MRVSVTAVHPGGYNHPDFGLVHGESRTVDLTAEEVGRLEATMQHRVSVERLDTPEPTRRQTKPTSPSHTKGQP